MIRAPAILVALLALCAPVAAAEQQACLTKEQQRGAIAAGQAVPLAQAVRSIRGTVRGRGSREVVKARLCRGQDGNLVYLLTVLSRDGKVSRSRVDAGSGRVVDAR